MKNESDFISKLLNPKYKEKAFAELLDLYQERLYWHIRKLVGSHENADDVLQNTFIKIYQNLANFKQQSSLHTWMYRIAHNESMRFIEQNKNKYSAAEQEITEHKTSNLIAETYIDGSEVFTKLKNGLQTLSDKQQKIFQMKYFDDLKFREIADILNLKENTIKTIYYSAVKHIEKYMLEINTIDLKTN